MIFFHLLWDLDYYGLSPMNNELYKYSQICPITFFVLVGICLTISYQHKTVKQIILRGLLILSVGFCITLASLLIVPDKPVTFGVLHCIGLSIILSSLFVKNRLQSILSLSILFIALGYVLNAIHIQNPTPVHLIVGIHQENLWQYTVDYFPLFPWFGIILSGMFLGKILYKGGKRQFNFPDIANYSAIRLLSKLGKHSLLVYLLHQPIIAGSILLYTFF